MEISILAVNCRTFRFNRPQPRAQTVLLARHAIILPNEGQERVTNPWKAQGRPKEGPSLCMTQLGSGNDFTCRAQGSAGNYKRCRRLPSADVHFVNFILEDCYTLALVKKTIDKRLFEYVFQANVKTNKIVCDSKTTRVQEDTDISLSGLEVT